MSGAIHGASNSGLLSVCCSGLETGEHALFGCSCELAAAEVSPAGSSSSFSGAVFPSGASAMFPSVLTLMRLLGSSVVAEACLTLLPGIAVGLPTAVMYRLRVNRCGAPSNAVWEGYGRGRVGERESERDSGIERLCLISVLAKALCWAGGLVPLLRLEARR